MTNLKQDLRQHHFSFGNQPLQYVSSAKSTLVSHEGALGTANKEAIDLSKKMQNQNFSIGDLRKREFKDAQSTYKSHISQQNTSQSTTRAPIQLGLRNSHFHLGTEKSISYVSESKNQF